MSALVLALPLDTWSMAAALTAIAIVAARGFRRFAGRAAPVLLCVGHDRRIAITTRDGRSRDGVILDDSYVGAGLTTIVWRPDRARRFAPARTMLILPDMLAPDEFRRLRVLLRYGRPVVAEETSGRDAG